MRGLLTIIAVAVMSLSGQLAFAGPEDGSQADEQAVSDATIDELTVNINTADAEALATVLDGVGLKRAQAIVDYREANGPFENAGDLVEVKGIGPSTMMANEGRIVVE